MVQDTRRGSLLKSLHTGQQQALDVLENAVKGLGDVKKSCLCCGCQVTARVSDGAGAHLMPEKTAIYQLLPVTCTLLMAHIIQNKAPFYTACFKCLVF